MKISIQAFVVLTVLVFGSCTSMQNQIKYENVAKQNEFDKYFPSASGEFTFSNSDEAYDYINEALAKFAQTSGKRRAKGLAATLTGPAIRLGQAQTKVVYFINMFGGDGNNVLTGKENKEELQGLAKSTVGSYTAFLVFYKGKAVVITCYFLKEGYVFNNNSFQTNFKYASGDYKADYPIGWTAEKAFAYLNE
jgi:hypothetical protein